MYHSFQVKLDFDWKEKKIRKMKRERGRWGKYICIYIYIYKIFTWEFRWVVVVYINDWNNSIHVFPFSFKLVVKIERNQLLFCGVETITWWHIFHLWSHLCAVQTRRNFSSLLVKTNSHELHDRDVFIYYIDHQVLVASENQWLKKLGKGTKRQMAFRVKWRKKEIV